MNCSMPNSDRSRCPGIRGISHPLLILLTFLSAPSLFAQDRIEWEPVDGADHYRVEIRQNEELILETRSDLPGIPLFLPPGEYQFLVSVINSLGKVAAVGEPRVLRITAPPIPFIVYLSPREIHEGSEVEYRVRVSGLAAAVSPGSEFLLAAEGMDSIKLVSALPGTTATAGGTLSEIALVPERKSPAAGTWNLVMTNPDGRSDTMIGALTVLDRLRPKITKVDPEKIPAGLVHNLLTLELSGMEPGAVIEFNGPSPLQAALLGEMLPGENKDTVLEYSLNLQEAAEGWYSVVLTNPSGGFDLIEKAFQVTPRPPTPEEIQAAYAIEIDKKEPDPMAERPHAVYGGWNFTFPIGDAADYLGNGYAGFSLGYSQDFLNNLFRRVAVLRSMAWDFTFSYSFLGTDYPMADINLNQYNFLLGINYVSPFDFPVNFIIRMGAGAGFSIYTSPDYDRDEWLGSFTLSDLDSLDFIARFGAGARIAVGSRWFIDLTCDFPMTFYTSHTDWMVQPRIEGGWRW